MTYFFHMVINLSEKKKKMFLFMTKIGFVQDTVKYTHQIYSISILLIPFPRFVYE